MRAETSNHLILLVDDDLGIRQAAKDILQDAGYHVVTACHGREALDFLRTSGVRPALILLDLTMPEMDGWAFRNEQKHDPLLQSIPVAVFTTQERLPDALRMAIADFVPKPVNYERLLATVERFCRPGFKHPLALS